jgi:hypothetical protein
MTGDSPPLGGTMIRRFDGFRRLLLRAAGDYRHELRGAQPELDLVPLNRILAGLGGPPAAVRLSVTLREPDSLPLLLLFLLTHPTPVRFVLSGEYGAQTARLRQLIHLFAQAAAPLLLQTAPLQFEEAVRELSDQVIALQPVVRYDRDGEVRSIDPSGAASELVLLAAPGSPLQLVIGGEEMHEVTATITQEQGGWLSYITGS